ncbi:hypothetical protein STCU_11227 [Strigomonas culicis]|uniref:Uncharacterized protein n=1 Tax=Strigomonas culicis TaxID=28005 RepID=S9TEJ5_9TRYP|nr:hypothetical protein STCU_11227 [Strigomonas culicis]|eukprot:EPY16472.1 hypothetical protein STCU_11227 [Strigomonas culicis]
MEYGLHAYESVRHESSHPLRGNATQRVANEEDRTAPFTYTELPPNTDQNEQQLDEEMTEDEVIGARRNRRRFLRRRTFTNFEFDLDAMYYDYNAIIE